jgi:hypothetical protein
MVCSINSKKLCNDINCLICWNKSFASSDKAPFFDLDKNNVEPRSLFKSCAKKCWFNCNDCNHSFETTLNCITSKKTWCSYCANQKLCDNNKCETCFNKSFASSNKAQYFNIDKNKFQPRQLFKSSNTKKYWFNCIVCNHVFQITLSEITLKNGWCPYCSHQTLCYDNDCHFCFLQQFCCFKTKHNILIL